MSEGTPPCKKKEVQTPDRYRIIGVDMGEGRDFAVESVLTVGPGGMPPEVAEKLRSGSWEAGPFAEPLDGDSR